VPSELLSEVLSPVEERVATLYETYRSLYYELAVIDDWTERVRLFPFMMLVAVIVTIGVVIGGRPNEDYPPGDPRGYDYSG